MRATEGPTTLLLVRHGRTAWNRTGRWHGQADVPLDDLGARQAIALADHMRRLRPDVVASSPLRRARDTAATLASAMIDPPPVLLDDRLKEVDVGEWEGLVDREVLDRDPSFLAARGEDRRFSDTGESPTECGARVASALGDLAAVHRAGLVLVVSHAYAIRAAVGTLLGWDLAPTQSLSGLFNCAHAELRAFPSGSWELVSWNNCDSRIPGQRSGEIKVL
ncbi:Phosphoserine phosphatase 1 [Propionicimonas sp. T2.31MG-18]|uniref:histidine phosphatase family protein n=1 Tax=Propionicimonas sp. T2.31MG-18 TaxID=3157620 RepID=UPI0035E9760E